MFSDYRICEFCIKINKVLAAHVHKHIWCTILKMNGIYGWDISFKTDVSWMAKFTWSDVDMMYVLLSEFLERQRERAMWVVGWGWWRKSNYASPSRGRWVAWPPPSGGECHLIFSGGPCDHPAYRSHPCRAWSRQPPSVRSSEGDSNSKGWLDNVCTMLALRLSRWPSIL